ncbi:Na+/H+ antiporter [Geminocystis sp. NIES-3708]|uniref:cation:proton antiporter domain-containing protein n=1 Tax=Geminocystis sp. NIES-3708 TaxID=1615909 RepID=UPI0005FC7838|nr:cation:proton antiporter [Geminocystis sp. NIES-3708]BAQ61009.1 Na+/H+ antiporter [Geminocystis sp. NIES-3708]
MEKFYDLIPDSPLLTFTILLLVIVTIPPLFEKIKLPGLVGLLVAGVILGNDGFGLLDKESESIKLLADIGKIYLMFVAGLEIDLADFRKSKNRSLTFGFCTFIVPLIMGTLVGLTFNMGINSSILLGSLLASHTLLGYPIVNRLGVVGNEAVVITIGATIFTDIGALLVLAICVSIHGGEFTLATLIFQLVSLAFYSFVILYGFDKAGKEYFRRTGDEESNQFLFVLLAVFLASVGAQMINVDKIVGAFLAGLAVNDVVGKGPVKEKVEFVGSTLFIPCFFVSIGLILNISGFIDTLSSDFFLTIAIVGGLFLSKFIAALIPKFLYKYNWDQCMTMWSLSLPQVAATLAATLVGVNAGLLSDSVFNVVIVMMLVTSVSGPIITGKFARNLFNPTVDVALIEPLEIQESSELAKEETFKEHNLIDSFSIVVPIANPHTEKLLIEIGAILARHEKGSIIPLSIVKAHVHMDEPELKIALNHSHKLLTRSVKYSQDLQVSVKPIIRIDDDLAEAISRVAKENQANLIVMGWSPNTTIQARLFGNLIDNVFWASHCPVAVIKILDEPNDIHQILVPVKNLDQKTLNIIRFASIFAGNNQGSLTLLHVHDRKINKNQIETFKSALSIAVEKIATQIPITIKTLRYPDTAQAIIHTAQKYDFDLVILRSVRRRTAGGLAVSDVTTEVVRQLTRSVIIFGEPY